MRTFIALPLHERTAVCLCSLAAKLARSSGMRVIPRKNLHCTLIFLGDLPGEALPAVQEALKRTAEHFSSFPVEFSSLVTFPPGAAAPRVAAVEAVGTGAGTLKKLHSLLFRELRQTGIPGWIEENRQRAQPPRFRPHITLCRSASRSGPFSRLPRDEIARYLPCLDRLDRMVLYKSNLSRAGASYDPLFTVELGT